jgi:hypothetical protein
MTHTAREYRVNVDAAALVGTQALQLNVHSDVGLARIAHEGGEARYGGGANGRKLAVAKLEGALCCNEQSGKKQR